MDDINFLANSYDGNIIADDRPSGSGSEIRFCDKPKIVVLEDDKNLANTISLYLKKSLNAEVLCFDSGSQFLENFIQKPGNVPFCLLADISLGKGHDGLFLLDLLSEKNTDFFSVVMTGFASIETAILATKKGVHQYLTKPFELSSLKDIIVDGFAQKLKMIVQDPSVSFFSSPTQNDVSDLNNKKEKSDDEIVLPELSEQDVVYGMVGRSAAMKLIFERIEKIANSSAAALITGEFGTGRETISNAIHNLSKGASKDLQTIRCDKTPAEFLGSELFGHISNNSNESVSEKKGKVELAQDSNLLICEISKMPMDLQDKILKMIQQKKFEAVGSEKTLEANLRVIATSSEVLDDAVEEETFNKDLFYRLNTIPVNIPPLRERKTDIPYLISFFLKKYVSADRRNMIRFSNKTFELLLNYYWPGNVKELALLIENLIVKKGGEVVLPEDLPNSIYEGNPLSDKTYTNLFELPDEGIELKSILQNIEDSLISQALERTKGNKNKASKLLGLNRTTLIEKIKKRNITYL